jgi:hypothetical protein
MAFLPPTPMPHITYHDRRTGYILGVADVSTTRPADVLAGAPAPTTLDVGVPVTAWAICKASDPRALIDCHEPPFGMRVDNDPSIWDDKDVSQSALCGSQLWSLRAKD